MCYKYVGCFNNLPPFDNAAYDLPRSPEEIGTEFLLFTQRNPSNPDRLDYVSQSSVVSSHFQSSIQTKIIIHGFANTVKTTWLYNMKDAFLTKVKKKVRSLPVSFVLKIKYILFKFFEKKFNYNEHSLLYFYIYIIIIGV